MSDLRLSPTERILRNAVLDPCARASPLVPDLTRLPLESQIVRRRPVEKPRRFAIGALCTIGLFFMAMALFEGAVAMALIAGFLLLIVAVITAVVAAASRMEWRAAWGAAEVRVFDRRWGKTREWSAPYTEFEGVAFRKLVTGNASLNGLSITYYLAELRHSDPLKTVLIASHRDTAKVEEAMDHAVAALGLPRLVT